MSINLALILTVLTLFTGVVYLLDILVWGDSKRSALRARPCQIQNLRLADVTRS